MRASFCVFSMFFAAICFLGQASAGKYTWAPRAHGGSATSDEAAKTDAPPPQIIVIGFVGGYVHRDDAVHSTVQLAARIREDYPSGAYINTFANHHGEDAHQAVLHALDANHDGQLSAAEKHNARIVIYGHSWGASETVALADALNRDGIPVLLTIQVDSVAKRGENDAVIPPNVAEAVNYYQKDGLLHGRSTIRAADPKRTHVIGNFRFAYGAKPIACEAAYPWWDRLVMQQHIAIECDPKVWHEMESLIRATLSPTNRSTPDSSSANATAATASRNPAP
ncbi:MAG: hypothetical protein WAL95_21190 [Candidatus Acidiferrales bacterium]